MEMKKILVTGGAGFVGRRFCKRFLDGGHKVHCVDNIVPMTGGLDPSAGWPLYEPRDYKNFQFFYEDCRSYFKRETADDFDAVFHLAAIVGGRMMIERNPLAVADDLAIDAAYWEWAASARPKKTVYFSSSAAYPVSLQRPDRYCLLREDMISREADIGLPDMTYGWSKLTGEYLAYIAHRHHDLNCVIYRPFSGYGEDQDDSYPFPAICRRILREHGSPCITVWGSGRQMRDFIHIEDCVDGVLDTMDRIDDADALNLSTGRFTSFKELVTIAAGLVGYDPEVLGLSDKPEGVFARAGDTAKQISFGFSAKIPLQTGVSRTLAHLETGQRQ
jgi:nucleoside-diphosphate-sugar epimerase